MYDEKSEYWRGVNNSKAREKWATYLASYTWDAFFTATSSSSSLRRHPISLLGRVRESVTSVVAVNRLFEAAEEFKLGDWHCHGLVSWHHASESPLFDASLHEIGKRLSGLGYCLVEPANSVPSVAIYLSKYVIKDTPWEYDISGTGWSAVTPLCLSIPSSGLGGLDKQEKLF